MPKGAFQDCCCQWPLPCGKPLLIHASTGDPPILAGGFGWVFCEVTAPFLMVLVHRFCLYSPRLETLFPSVLWKSYNQIPLAFKVRFPGNSQSLCWSPGWESWHGVQNLYNSGKTPFVLLFSSLWVTNPAGIGFDFYCGCAPPTVHCVFFFVFGCGMYFCGEFQHPPVNGCSTASCDFGALAEGDECMSYSAILNWKLK